MLRLVACTIFISLWSAAFSATNYNTGDGHVRSETMDENGNVRGQYSYVDPTGKTVSVKYSAGKDGFQVENGEPSAASPAGFGQYSASPGAATPQQLFNFNAPQATLIPGQYQQVVQSQGPSPRQYQQAGLLPQQYQQASLLPQQYQQATLLPQQYQQAGLLPQQYQQATPVREPQQEPVPVQFQQVPLAPTPYQPLPPTGSPPQIPLYLTQGNQLSPNPPSQPQLAQQFVGFPPTQENSAPLQYQSTAPQQAPSAAPRIATVPASNPTPRFLSNESPNQFPYRFELPTSQPIPSGQPRLFTPGSNAEQAVTAGQVSEYRKAQEEEAKTAAEPTVAPQPAVQANQPQSWNPDSPYGPQGAAQNVEQTQTADAEQATYRQLPSPQSPLPLQRLQFTPEQIAQLNAQFGGQ